MPPGFQVPRPQFHCTFLPLARSQQESWWKDTPVFQHPGTTGVGEKCPHSLPESWEAGSCLTGKRRRWNLVNVEPGQALYQSSTDIQTRSSKVFLLAMWYYSNVVTKSGYNFGCNFVIKQGTEFDSQTPNKHFHFILALPSFSVDKYKHTFTCITAGCAWILHAVWAMPCSLLRSLQSQHPALRGWLTDASNTTLSGLLRKTKSASWVFTPHPSRWEQLDREPWC